MSFSHGSKAVVFGNGYSLSAYLNNFALTRDVDSAETSTFGNTFKTFVPGLYGGTMTADGIYDGAANAVDQVFNAALGSVSDDVITWFPQGEGLGNAGYG